MNKYCKVCGYTVDISDTNCPFCNSSIKEQDEIKDTFVITPKLKDLFNEEKIEIKFNEKSIVNDVDIDLGLDKKNNVKNVKHKDEYLQIDITNNNIERVKELLSFYEENLQEYINTKKKNLENLGIRELQEYIEEFNKIVNLCNKYKKIIKSNTVKQRINNIIKNYNKEIHYIKKYFILPLYDSEDILNGSRIAKNFINIIALLISYFVISKVSLLEPVYAFFIKFLEQPVIIPYDLKIGNLNTLVSIPFSIWLTNILFTFYIELTIKNKNFKVDKDKSYEVILTFTVIGYLVSIYHISLSLFYNGVFILYILYLVLVNIKTKKRGLNWLFVKIASIIFVIPLIINLILFCM